jgi:anaerobic selenocysteine-containing dehydrogenase
VDKAFIRDHTSGFEAWAAQLAAESWETLEEQAGVTQHTYGEDAVKAIRILIAFLLGFRHENH